jgi:hypothetical protein
MNIKIEQLRQKMVDAAKQFGLNHPSVMEYSQELDKCLNKLIQNKEVS